LNDLRQTCSNVCVIDNAISYTEMAARSQRPSALRDVEHCLRARVVSICGDIIAQGVEPTGKVALDKCHFVGMLDEYESRSEVFLDATPCEFEIEEGGELFRHVPSLASTPHASPTVRVPAIPITPAAFDAVRRACHTSSEHTFDQGAYPWN
jgi:hypothetical protein